MPLCPDGQTTVGGICPTSKVINIQCVPDTTGMPNYTPAPDQIPIAHDVAGNTLWVHTCENSWVSFAFDYTLCTLPVADTDGLGDPCTAIGIAVTVDNGVGCEQGILTLGEISAAVAACENLSPDTNDTSVLVPIASGNEIATHDDGTGTVVSIQETITSLASDGLDGLNFTDEAGVVSNVPASGLGVNSTSILTQVVLTGNNIANHDDGTGTIVAIRETNTSFTPDGSGGFDYEAEDGTIYNIPFDVVTTLVDNGDNTISYTDEVASVAVISLTQVTEGEGIDVTGVGSSGTPYIVSLDLCELTILTNQQVIDATDVKIAGCVDGANILMSVQSATSTVLGASLTLVLDNNPEVAGVNYNTVSAAYDYALTVLQVGGRLTLTIAAATTITETQSSNFDSHRIRITITGSSQSTSIIAIGGFRLTFAGGAVAIFDCRFTGSSTTETLLFSGLRLHWDATIITTGLTGALNPAMLLREVECGTMIMTSVATRGNLWLTDGSKVYNFEGSLESTEVGAIGEFPILRVGVKSFLKRADGRPMTITSEATSNITAVYCIHNSNMILFNEPTFIGGVIGNEYEPIPNQTHFYNSWISTQAEP